MSENALRVPTRLLRPHPQVAATRDALANVKSGFDGRIQTKTKPGVVRVVVSRAQLGRSLRLLQASFVEAERRGYTIEESKSSYPFPTGVAIVAGGFPCGVRIDERSDRVPMTEADAAQWERDNAWVISWRGDKPPATKPVPNGILCLSIPPSSEPGRRSKWTEGRLGPLERRLAHVLAEIEARVPGDQAPRQAREREQEEWKRQAEESRRQEELARQERVLGERLAGEVAAWRFAKETRQYVAELRSHAKGLPPKRQANVQAWCDWAEAYIERADPSRKAW